MNPRRLLVLLVLLPIVVAVPNCPTEMEKAITVSPAALVYSKQVVRSRETSIGNLVAASSYSFLVGRQSPKPTSPGSEHSV
jgi:hypothetical protein